MPRLIVTANAARGLERCPESLRGASVVALQRSGAAIKRHLALLEAKPELGLPCRDDPQLREHIITFGYASYVVAYRHLQQCDQVVVLAFREWREAGGSPLSHR